MLARHIKRGLRVNRSAAWRLFSTTEAPAESEQPSTIPEPTEAEKEAARSEWGVKYDDECLKFEKEWELIARKVIEE